MTPDRAPAADPLVNGRFRLEAPVGTGSSGVVYRALDLETGRDVAVKILTLGTLRTDHDNVVQQFLKEADLLARLQHPNTVRVLDYGSDDGRPYVAMEYFDGTTLEDLIQAGDLTPKRLLCIVRSVCQALAEAHTGGLIHRDLKPENILVSTDGENRVKVVDFGLAKEVGDAVSMTGDGLLLGTPLYMAPEQIRGRPLDRRCDIYALGAILYAGVTGRPPFDRKQTAATLMAHLNDPVPPMGTFVDTPVPRLLEEVVLRCLRKARSDRFDSVDALEHALDACVRVLDDPQADEEVSLRMFVPSATPRATSINWTTLLTGALALGSLLVFGYVVAQGVQAVQLATNSPQTSHDPVVTRPSPPPEQMPPPWENPFFGPDIPPPYDAPVVPQFGKTEVSPKPLAPSEASTTAIQPATEGPLNEPAPLAEPPAPERPARPRFPVGNTDLKNPFDELEKP